MPTSASHLHLPSQARVASAQRLGMIEFTLTIIICETLFAHDQVEAIMADHASCPPLTRASVQIAHQRIVTFVHRTPVETCETINKIASLPQSKRCPKTGKNVANEPCPHQHDVSEDPTLYIAQPKVKVFFKCENLQRIGAFKARGAFHALGRLIEEEGLENVREKGVCTHSSGMMTTDRSCIHG